ncbi:DUF349 domain-containing protein, partial [Flavobacterium sp. UBA6046]|uniref:DUF349 domain-containing protein n=1 Tax=Flavobacterium sp. UBA6046 TaxID=1946552 RepID=UPI0025BD522B
MLEEKTDNLLEADGNLANNSLEMIQIETEILEEAETVEPSDSEISVEMAETVETVSDEDSSDSEQAKQLTETEATIEPKNQTPVDSETPVLEEIEIVESSSSEIAELAEENNATLTDGDPSDSEQAKQLAEADTLVETKNKTAIDAIADTNAEESEDETLKNRHDIPMLDYDTLSLESLVDELKNLVTNEKVMSIKDHVEEIKKSFLAKYYHLLEEKKEEFIAENPDTTEEFQYHSPLKTKFDQYYSLFRDNKNTHFKSLQTNLKSNLENRLSIVEELKELINPQENIKDTLKHFNDLRERWKNAGPIPKDKYNHVWNNYHFHVENFYDYLHLDREARDLDFKHNLEQKQKIVARVEELVNEADINKAFRELQDLHKIWKEDIGPVSREHRDEIWNKFSDLTKQMHDKREVLFENLRGTELENLEKKREIVAKIEVLATEKVNAHSQWLGQIEKVEALRTAFFSAGKVPSEVNEETWTAFKTAVRNFNSFKNSFYKDIKKDQNDNLNKKKALVAKAKELQESLDFAATTPIMKKIQEEWKQIGHVPRKYSDKIWAEFKEACNNYFDKLKE